MSQSNNGPASAPICPHLPMAVLGRLSEAAERVMRDHMNPLFAEAGLQPGEFDVLATLRRSGEPYMLSPTQLYEALMISSGGMTGAARPARARRSS